MSAWPQSATARQPQAPEDSQAPKRDFRHHVTDNIIRMLEKGVAPWQKPWDSAGSGRMPMNPTTERSYRGGNAVHLLAVGLQKGYEDPRWMTYKQAVRRVSRITGVTSMGP